MELEKAPVANGELWTLVNADDQRMVGFRLTCAEADELVLAVRHFRRLADSARWLVGAMERSDADEIQAAWSEARERLNAITAEQRLQDASANDAA